LLCLSYIILLKQDYSWCSRVSLLNINLFDRRFSYFDIDFILNSGKKKLISRWAVSIESILYRKRFNNISVIHFSTWSMTTIPCISYTMLTSDGIFCFKYCSKNTFKINLIQLIKMITWILLLDQALIAILVLHFLFQEYDMILVHYINN